MVRKRHYHAICNSLIKIYVYLSVHSIRDRLRLGRAGETGGQVPDSPEDRQGPSIRTPPLYAQGNLRRRLSGSGRLTANSRTKSEVLFDASLVSRFDFSLDFGLIYRSFGLKIAAFPVCLF